ncbi:MAG: helix-turn-helix domain-containing protein [Patescibacteria group bacterium]
MPTLTDARLLQDFQRLGLSDKAALIYSTLLELGGAYPSKVAELTHLNRSTVYKVLLDLSVKGLVTEIDKDKKLYYQAERPDQLLRYAKNRKTAADEQYEKIRSLLPQIEALYSSNPNKPKIRYFENKAGIEALFMDHLNVTKPYEMLGFANTTELEKFMTTNFLRSYVKVKEKIGITTRGIIPDTKSDRSYNARIYRDIKKKIHLQLRYIPLKEFPFSGEITIYGDDRVSIMNFSDKQLMGIIIEDKGIHEMMVRIFELAWKGAK